MFSVTPDSRCAKDTSTVTEHAPNARERARGSSISKDVPNGSQIIRESLEVKGIFKRTGDIILQCGTLNQYSSYITKCITFYCSQQIDLCITHFIPSIRFSS